MYLGGAMVHDSYRETLPFGLTLSRAAFLTGAALGSHAVSSPLGPRRFAVAVSHRGPPGTPSPLVEAGTRLFVSVCEAQVWTISPSAADTSSPRDLDEVADRLQDVVSRAQAGPARDEARLAMLRGSSTSSRKGL